MTTAIRPRPLSVRPDRIPDALKALPRWLVWRYVEDVDRETGQVSYDKPPLNVRGGPGSSTNPKTWSTYADALAAYTRGNLDGLGFVLNRAKGQEQEPGLVGVDLDHCRDVASGKVKPWAEKIVRQLNSYTETSPSGEGLRLFLIGALPPFGRKRGDYENYQSGRYVTVTGQHLAGTLRTIEPRQAELLAVHAQFWPPAESADGRPNNAAVAPRVPNDLDDAELVARASRAKNGEKFSKLWQGEIAGYARDGNAGRSEADLALCNYLAFWSGGDEARIADLFAQSGLYRSKWNRHDYRVHTIGLAMKGRTDFYKPRKARPSGNGHVKASTREAPASESDDRLPADDGNTGKEDPAADMETTDNGTEAPQDKPDDIHLTDKGNAQRVVKDHGKDLRYCHPMKKWNVWDNRRWKDDDTGEVIRRVKDTQSKLFRWALAKLKEFGESKEDEEDEGRAAKRKQLKQLLIHCLKWEETRSINASVESMRSEPGMQILPSQLDRDPYLFNVLNGTVDLRKGRLLEHHREDFISKLAPVENDPEAKCPLWLSCLNTWMAGNADLIGYLQRAIGYALTGEVDEQCLWFLHGGGQNGKTVFLRSILEMLGDYGVTGVDDLLMQKRNQSHPTERASLFGKRFVLTTEQDQGRKLAEALMKQLSGGDVITARRMYENFWDFQPTFKIFLAANHKPEIQGQDFAVWRRIKLVPWSVKIAEDRKDPALLKKLKAERSGILNWAIQGCLNWQRNGMQEPREVTEATQAYKAEQNALGEFLTERCTLNSALSVRAGHLHDAFEKWTGQEITRNAFAGLMEANGYRSVPDNDKCKVYKGIGLNSPTSTGDYGDSA